MPPFGVSSKLGTTSDPTRASGNRRGHARPKYNRPSCSYLATPWARVETPPDASCGISRRSSEPFHHGLPKQTRLAWRWHAWTRPGSAELLNHRGFGTVPPHEQTCTRSSAAKSLPWQLGGSECRGQYPGESVLSRDAQMLTVALAGNGIQGSPCQVLFCACSESFPRGSMTTPSHPGA